MGYKEELLWILDKPGTTLQNQDETFRANIRFVHELGLKCDSVGWSRLDLSSPGAAYILTAIETFCKANRWGARGWYTRTYAEADSEWYALMPGLEADGFFASQEESVSDRGAPMRLVNVRAWKDAAPSPKCWGDTLLVPDRFRAACRELGLPGVAFCWARDLGKHQAEQYFSLHPAVRVPRFGGGYHLDYRCRSVSERPDAAIRGQYAALGGALPRLAEVFYELNVSLPDCYLRSDLPESGICDAWRSAGNIPVGRPCVLLHRDTAAALCAAKAVSRRNLQPVYTADAMPEGYRMLTTMNRPCPAQAVVEERMEACERWYACGYPARVVTEKDALKRLRAQKKERPDDFRKPLPKKQADTWTGTSWAPLLPWYRIANGGSLSDEYELIPAEEIPAETEDFRCRAEAEELWDTPPQGMVFARCPDGDRVLLETGGRVLRLSHEGPEICAQWPDFPHFIFAALTENE